MLCLIILSLIKEAVIHLEPQNYTLARKTILFQSGMYNSKHYRIPAVQYLKDQSIIAVVDQRVKNANDLPNDIGVVVRRLPPHSTKWSDGYLITGPIRSVGDGDPAIAIDRKTGTVFCLWSGDRGFWGSQMSSPSNPERVYFSRSYDNGITWEERHDITKYIYSDECENCSETQKEWIAVFVTSGGGIQTREGRLTFAMLCKNAQTSRNFLLYTDDFGETWGVEQGWAVSNANEAKLVELNNGTLLMSVRQTQQRKFAYTNDLGKSWYYAAPMPDVVDSGSNGEIKRYTSVIDGYDRNRLLHSISYNPSSRKNVSLMISYDEGLTWPYKRHIETSSSCYSAITIDDEGNILVLYEDEGSEYYDIVLANVTLDWLTFGTDHYTKPNKLNWCLTNNDDQAKICPSGSYKFNSKVFDQYVESYTLYPKDVTYTFTESFRDFYIDLNHQGLNKGTYDNQKSDKNIKIDFKGTRKIIPTNLVDGEVYRELEMHREFSFINVDPTFTGQNYKSKKITLKNSNLVINGVGNATIYYGTDSIVIKQNSNEKEDTTINIVSGSVNNILLEINSNVTLRKSTKSLSLLADSSLSFTIKPVNDKSSIIVEDSWTKQEADKINFESGTSSGKVQVVVDKDNKDAFVGDTNLDVKDATPVPTPEIQYVETVSVTVSPVEVEKEVIVEKNVGVPLVLAACLAIGMLVIGIVATAVVLYVTKIRRKKDQDTLDLDPLNQPLA